MNLRKGYFSLAPIFDFAARYRDLPSPGSLVQSEYSELLKKVVESVPELPGWYDWGRFDASGRWDHLYIGKASRDKKRLRTRMYDHLREDAAVYWAELHGAEGTLSQQHKAYPHGNYDEKTRRILDRLNEFGGARFVVWVGVEGAISDEEITHQEKVLITDLIPKRNVHRYINYPRASDDHTKNIESAIEATILTITEPK